MAKLTISFDAIWQVVMKISANPTYKGFSFDVEGNTVREALSHAFKSHHTFVAPLFDKQGNIELPNDFVRLFLNGMNLREFDGVYRRSCPNEEMLDLPLREGCDLYVSSGVGLG